MPFAKHTEVVEELQRSDHTNTSVTVELVTVQGVETANYAPRGMPQRARPRPSHEPSRHGRLLSQMGDDHSRYGGSHGGSGLFSVFKGMGAGGNRSVAGGRRRSRSIIN